MKYFVCPEDMNEFIDNLSMFQTLGDTFTIFMHYKLRASYHPISRAFGMVDCSLWGERLA